MRGRHDVAQVFDEPVERVAVVLVGRDRTEGLQVLGGGTLIGGTLGLLLVLSNVVDLALPSWLPMGLFVLGLSVPALVNGYREGGLAASWLAAGVVTFPLAFALAPSGPYTLTLVAILLKAARWTVVLGAVAGSTFHAVGWTIRRIRGSDRRATDQTSES